MLVTGSSNKMLADFISALKSEFAMIDMGLVHYFLGIEFTQTFKGLFLSQHRYIQQLLSKAKMTDCKPVSTPITAYYLKIEDDREFTDVSFYSFYRMLVGSLQYLTITRPDICYVVNTVCQHMQKPSFVHYQMVKRILRYHKDTIDIGQLIVGDSSLMLSTYPDYDWAGCKLTRRSTTGFCTRLGVDTIFWSSKKQTTVARSSTEVQYRALATTATEIPDGMSACITVGPKTITAHESRSPAH